MDERPFCWLGLFELINFKKFRASDYFLYLKAPGLLYSGLDYF